MRKIGIITWHYGTNHGSVLQALSLSDILCEMGHDARVLNYMPNRYGKFLSIRLFAGHIIASLAPWLYKMDTYASDCFRAKHLKQTKPLYNIKQLEYASTHFDTIICGSDQIWAPNVLNSIFFANFAKEGTLKVSYAVSIGLNYIPKELVSTYRKYLIDFKYISVREDIGHDLLKNICGLDSEVVLDPTLLHDSEYYVKFERKVKKINGKFIFCYFLNSNHNYADYIKNFAKENNLRVIGISCNKRDNSWMTCLNNTSASDFLYLIRNSEYIFTDSYHGSIFSILYKKKFWIFERFMKDDPVCQNSRIMQLQKYFNLHNIVDKANFKFVFDVDYDFVENQLSLLRDLSISYLKNALE